MSTQELSSIALRVVGQYHDASKSLVSAYRTGAQRLLDGAASRRGETSKLNEFLSSRLQADTERFDTLIDNLANLQTRGIEDMAARATQVEQTSTVAFLDMLASLQLPQAKLSEQIAVKVAEGAKSLASRAQDEAAKAAAAPTVTEVAADVTAQAVEAVQDLVEPKARRSTRSAE